VYGNCSLEDVKMARLKEHPRYNIISFRVTDEEMAALKQLRKKGRTTFDQLIREALAATDLPVNRVPDDGPTRSMSTG
jgi:hypothetical protein